MSRGFDFNSYTGVEGKILGPRKAEIGAEALHKPGTLEYLHPQERLEKFNLIC